MDLLGLFGKKVTMQCNCGCGCREIFEKYSRKTMYHYEHEATRYYRKKWRGDFEICMDCNLDQHTNVTTTDTKSSDRKKFSTETETATFEKQGERCNKCQKKLGMVNGRPVHCEYDHIDGDPSNNHLSNCQALCLDCHRNKTAREKNYKSYIQVFQK